MKVRGVSHAVRPNRNGININLEFFENAEEICLKLLHNNLHKNVYIDWKDF
jgi:hypothetical protein